MVDTAKLPAICIGVNVLDALLLMTLGVVTIIQTTGDAARFLISVYVIFFAGVLMLGQFDIGWLNAEFSFLQSYFGRSILAFFIGTLCLGLKLFGIAVGGATCLVAFFNMWMQCKFGDSADKSAPSSGEPAKADAYGTAGSSEYTPASEVWKPAGF
eukprot:TRINITY_DN8754_c0_g1_i1.p1 TRINITY_DN8754_c0_g1~~TRINITY_DN8754_c0_g1_i1.p1  ORF type:complete len:156 (-),score=31.11 TRINITY_DN8754_c0_g1_i1:302-769(-)